MSELHIAVASPLEPDVRALIDALDALQLELYPAESNHLVDPGELTADDVVFLAARLDGRAAGCGAVMLTEDEDGRYGEIKRVYVDPACRGQSIARHIMTMLEQALLARDISCVRLETGILQPEAVGLYERLGYMTRGPFGDYPNDPLSIFMEKKLSA